MTPQEQYQNAVLALLGSGTPLVTKRADLDVRQLGLSIFQQMIDDAIAAVETFQMNFIENGADVATTTNIILQTIKEVDGIAGFDGMIVLALGQTNLYDRKPWVMRAGAWEELSGVNYNKLMVMVNHGTLAGSIYVQISPPPFNAFTSMSWRRLGRLSSTGGWALAQEQQAVTLQTTADGQLAFASQVDYAFSGKIRVSLGVEGDVSVYDGVNAYQNYACYFTVGSSTTARKNGEVQVGDQLRWNGSKLRNLEAGEILKLSGVIAGRFSPPVTTGIYPIVTVTNSTGFASAQTGSFPILISFIGDGLYFFQPGSETTKLLNY